MALSRQLIETLVDLVESKLLHLSANSREHSAEYKSLQDCRYALLAMASRADGNFSRDGYTVTGHLTAIPGGKA